MTFAEKSFPREIYRDNAKQFTAKEFKAKARKHGIKLIFGKPYHPKGRGEI
jgi:putative transposase